MTEPSMKKQALLIGINEYQNLSKLKYARQDAESVADALKRNYCFSDDEIILLTDAKQGCCIPSTKKVIQRHFEDIINQKEEFDLFIFGFWGHGLYRKGQRYLCPQTIMDDEVCESGFPFALLQELLSSIKAKNTCMILDCCQTVDGRGDAEKLTDADQTVMENAPRDIVLNKDKIQPGFQSNVAILNSCSKGQCAYEWDDRKHGIFTAHLLDAMSCRYDSVSGVVKYITPKMKQTTLNLGKKQMPFYKMEGEGDILLPVPQSLKFVLPDRSKDAVIEKPEIEDIKVTFTPGEIEQRQRIEYNEIQLPPLPEELTKIQAENKGREIAIAQLKDLTHESLAQANAAVAQAQAQLDAWTERKERLWKDLSEEVKQSLEKTVSDNPKSTEADITVPTDDMSDQEYIDLLEQFQCGKKCEQARLELERVQQQRQEKCENVIKEFQQKIESEKARVKEIKVQFMDEVLFSILAVMPGYEKLDAEFPEDVFLEPLRLLGKYELGWRAPAEIARARVLWNEQRPCVLEREPDLFLPGRRAGERAVMTVNGVEFAFRWCPAGTFMMGSPSGEDGRAYYETQHQVTLTKGFWMMETQVTQKQWKAVMGNNPSHFKGDDLPVEEVSWYNCQEFCKKCAQLGLPVQLPTEAQWEYACRAGTTGAYAGNLDDMAWYTSNSGSKTHPVGTKKANAWGLYDMHGNVREWCADRYGKKYPSGSVTDPAGHSYKSRRVNRGGCWTSNTQSCRSAYRDNNDPVIRLYYLGFRVVRGQ